MLDLIGATRTDARNDSIISGRIGAITLRTPRVVMDRGKVNGKLVGRGFGR